MVDMVLCGCYYHGNNAGLLWFLQGDHSSWKVMEFSKTIFQAWKVMENSQAIAMESHGK